MAGSREDKCNLPALLDRLRDARLNAIKVREETIAQRARLTPVVRAIRDRYDADEWVPPLGPPLDGRPLATRLITIGGSAGAMSAVSEVVAALPADFPAAIVIVVHGGVPADTIGILARRSRCQLRWASSSDMLRDGAIYLAPPDHHVVVNPDARLTVSAAPRVRFSRPSVDWLFESAAAAFRERHVAVVLSGRLNDGAAGARAVVRCGGVVYALDPASCQFSGMPRAAIETGCVSEVLSERELLAAILRSVSRGLDEDEPRWREPFAS